MRILVLALLATLLPATVALEEPGVDERLGAVVPGELRLVDHHGEQRSLRQLIDGRATLLVPAYYSCPQLCGLNLKALSGCAEELEGIDLDTEVTLLAVSFDPADTASVAAERRRGLVGDDGGPDWDFAVVDEADRDAFLRAIGWRVVRDPETGEYAHPAGAVVLTPDGRVARYLHGLEPRPRDLQMALIEAGEGSVGSTVDQLVMLCYRYDPAQRRYGLFVGGFLRVGALVVMLGAALGVVLLVRRVRRREDG